MAVRALTIAVLAALLAAPVFGLSEALGIALLFIAVGALAWAMVEGAKLRRSRDPYDLGELRRVHDEEKWRPGDPEDTQGAPAWVICPRCFGEYDSRLRTCPRCSRSVVG